MFLFYCFWFKLFWGVFFYFFGFSNFFILFFLIFSSFYFNVFFLSFLSRKCFCVGNISLSCTFRCETRIWWT